MINILEICLSPNYGGLEIHMRDFSIWLSKNSECTVHTAVRKNTRLNDALSILKIPIKTYSSKSGIIPFIRAQKLARYIEKNKIDLVHVHWKYDLLLVALAKRFSKQPFKIVHTRQMSLPGKKFDPYHKFIYSSIDCYIAITKRVALQAENNLPLSKDRIIQIYYGVEIPTEVKSATIKELKAKFSIEGKFVVGLIGRISEFKGQHLLLEAIDKLRSEAITINAVIVGEAFDTKYLKKLKVFVKEKNLTNQVKFLDFYSKPYELMSCFNALVLTTKIETFGLVLVEAMHCGIPVIGSNAGGVPEIIEDGVTGLLFESLNSQSLGAALKRIFTDEKLRNRIARMGKEKARKEFDAKIQYQKVFQVMNESL